ncbi:hypothetical protein HMPREF1979_03026 [Actinomyces johnsonii F0542]|uniref:Uncharacterized protein n=1 Tax=Actinomyces johnsonii F0542 TaxID=1321818 RepID=U1RQ23_9ACTO|nr:hypothetical protein HMPREF1979_03026 [Actinomyces johnsonii F0542]
MRPRARGTFIGVLLEVMPTGVNQASLSEPTTPLPREARNLIPERFPRD